LTCRYFGGEVLHPSAMGPCIGKDIVIHVRNFLNPSSQGTVISQKIATRLVTHRCRTAHSVAFQPRPAAFGRAARALADAAFCSSSTSRMLQQLHLGMLQQLHLGGRCNSSTLFCSHMFRRPGVCRRQCFAVLASENIRKCFAGESIRQCFCGACKCKHPPNSNSSAAGCGVRWTPFPPNPNRPARVGRPLSSINTVADPTVSPGGGGGSSSVGAAVDREGAIQPPLPVRLVTSMGRIATVNIQAGSWVRAHPPNPAFPVGVGPPTHGRANHAQAGELVSRTLFWLASAPCVSAAASWLLRH
jgi:hypothetical protein